MNQDGTRDLPRRHIPQWVPPAPRIIVTGLLIGLAAGLAYGLPAWLAYGLPVGLAGVLAAWLTAGLAAGLAALGTRGWVDRAARCPRWRVLFGAVPRRTGRARFPGIRLSSDLCRGWDSG